MLFLASRSCPRSENNPQSKSKALEIGIFDIKRIPFGLPFTGKKDSFCWSTRASRILQFVIEVGTADDKEYRDSL